VAVRGESCCLRRRTERTSALVRLVFGKLSAADATVVLHGRHFGYSVSSVEDSCWD
jgi:hypothetical protein